MLVVASRAAIAKRVERDSSTSRRSALSGSVQARDVRSGEPLVLSGDRLSVPLPARSYTYVTLR